MSLQDKIAEAIEMGEVELATAEKIGMDTEQIEWELELLRRGDPEEILGAMLDSFLEEGREMYNNG